MTLPNPAPPGESSTPPWIQRLHGWRLKTLIIALTVVLTDAVVALVSIVITGQIGPNALVIGTVSGLIIATVVVVAVDRVGIRIADVQREYLERGIRQAQNQRDLAVDTGRMVYWELDLVSGQLFFDREKLAWLSLESGIHIGSLADWISIIHPEDRDAFNSRLQAVLVPGSPDFELEYRLRQSSGSWVWVLTRGRVTLRDGTGKPLQAAGGSINIDRGKKVEAALRRNEALLRMVADNVPDMIWAKDTQKRYLFANKAICDQLLFARDTSEPLGKDDMFFAQRQRNLRPDNPEWHTFGELCQDSDAVTLEKGRASQFDEFGNVQGKFLFLDVNKAPLVSDTGEVIGVVGSARNVTGQHEAQERLKLSALVLANASEALVLSDAANRIVDINPAFTRLTGYTLEEVRGRDPNFLASGLQDAKFYDDMWKQIHATGQWQGEVWNRRKDGEIFAEWLTISTLFHDDGTVLRRVGLFSDITEKKRSDELIWTQANFDPLTGLPNRRMFLDRLAQDLKKAQRTGTLLALMFLDLDQFKEINDTLGHTAGDHLLIEAARRIAGCARGSDTVARLSGDEFTVILSDLQDTTSVERIAGEILSALCKPVALGSEQVFISVSIGITLFPQDSLTPEDLLKNADQAMYVSKLHGRNRFSFFTPTMQANALHRMEMVTELRSALHLGQLSLHYQPIVSLRTGQIHKAEALLRWQHPLRGAVSPAEFIPLAENSGLIHDIGDWVFAQATQQLRVWRDSWAPQLQISVNLSPVQLHASPGRLNWRQHLQSAGLKGSAVAVEITEGLLLDKSAGVTNELLAFRDAGVQVAIDDFGTGYSAMAYLTQMDIDYLKIDQSFVRNLDHEGGDHALCEAMVVMAHKLGLKVIAEGVETTQQRDLLAAMGCDYVQGYLYGRPLPVEAFGQLLQHQLEPVDDAAPA